MMRSGMGKQMQGPRAPMAVRPGIGRPNVTTPVMPQGVAPPPNLASMAGKLASQTPTMPANMPSSSGQSIPPIVMGPIGGAGTQAPPMTQSAARSAMGFKKGGMVSKGMSKGKQSSVTPKAGKAGGKNKPCKIC